MPLRRIYVAVAGLWPLTTLGLFLMEPFFFFEDVWKRKRQCQSETPFGYKKSEKFALTFFDMNLELRFFTLRSPYGIRGRLNSSGFLTLQQEGKKPNIVILFFVTVVKSECFSPVNAD